MSNIKTWQDQYTRGDIPNLEGRIDLMQTEIDQLRSALVKAEQERDQYREETRWQGRRIRELTDEQAALAAQEPLTESYVQSVPDKCDRITWRNRYYNLPISETVYSAAGAAAPKEPS